jgi:tetratricopeptide (TPR) repeat protein
MHLMEERYDASAADFARLAAARPDDFTALYNLACVRARQGRGSEALRWLEKAFAAGWSDLAHTAADPDLAALRLDPTFQRLLRGDRAD